MTGRAAGRKDGRGQARRAPTPTNAAVASPHLRQHRRQDHDPAERAQWPGDPDHPSRTAGVFQHRHRVVRDILSARRTGDGEAKRALRHRPANRRGCVADIIPAMHDRVGVNAASRRSCWSTERVVVAGPRRAINGAIIPVPSASPARCLARSGGASRCRTRGGRRCWLSCDRPLVTLSVSCDAPVVRVGTPSPK